jgi:hypothetical protein
VSRNGTLDLAPFVPAEIFPLKDPQTDIVSFSRLGVRTYSACRLAREDECKSTSLRPLPNHHMPPCAGNFRLQETGRAHFYKHSRETTAPQNGGSPGNEKRPLLTSALPLGRPRPARADPCQQNRHTSRR